MDSSLELCPNDARRTSTELYWKLGLSALFAISSLLSLLPLQQNLILVILLVFLLPSPITVATFLLLGILTTLWEIPRRRYNDFSKQTTAEIHENEKGYASPEQINEPVLTGRTASARHLLSRFSSGFCLLTYSIHSLLSIRNFSRRSTTALVDQYILQLCLVQIMVTIAYFLEIVLNHHNPWLASASGAPAARWIILIVPYLSIIGSTTSAAVDFYGFRIWSGPWISYHYFSDLPWNILGPVAALSIAFLSVVILVFKISGPLPNSVEGPLLFITLLVSMPTFIVAFYLTLCALTDVSLFVLEALVYNSQLLPPALEYARNQTTGFIACPLEADWNRIATFSALPVSCPCAAALKDGIVDLVQPVVQAS